MAENDAGVVQTNLAFPELEEMYPSYPYRHTARACSMQRWY